MPHGGYNPYNQPYNPAAVAYNNDQGEEEEEEEEQDPYYRGYPPQYYPRHHPAPHGYHSGPGHSEDVELRSPGVVQRFPRDVGRQESIVPGATEESEEEGLKRQA